MAYVPITLNKTHIDALLESVDFTDFYTFDFESDEWVCYTWQHDDNKPDCYLFNKPTGFIIRVYSSGFYIFGDIWEFINDRYNDGSG